MSKKKSYEKPKLKSEKLFEATVLTCGKTSPTTPSCQAGLQIS